MIKYLLCYFITKIKKRPFTIDNRVSTLDFLSLFICKFFDSLRGIIYFRKVVFIGKGCSFWGKNQIQFEQGVNIGSYTEIHGVSEEGLRVGEASSIGRNCIIKVSGTLTDIGKGIKIGSHVGIGDFSHIGGAGGLVIGSNTITGAFLSIHPENHNFQDTKKLIREQGVNRRGISIGKNCWLGAKVTVLDGSAIGDGCVVAAGAVVSGVFPNSVVIGGIPARILKEINNE